MSKLKTTLDEFKTFAVSGNIVDMAVGVIIGGAFGKIVTSLVNDIIMPAVSVFTKGQDFASLFVSLDGVKYETLEAATEAGAAVIKYGAFISQIVDFFIIALIIFITIKKILQHKKSTPEPEPAAPTTKTCPFCYTEIHIDATRCPNCTSLLDAEPKTE